MRSKRIPAEKQYRLIMECRQSGLTDLSDLWRCAHEKQKNTCRKTIPSHHGMPSKWIDRSSMVCGTRHQTGNFLQLGECRQSGLTDHQWCVEHDIKPGTFYNWVKRLRQKGCMDLPASTGRNYRAPESQEVVRVDFHDTDPLPYEQPLNVIPVATERNNLSVAEPMKLSVGNFHLTIPNGTDPQLLAQTLRFVKEVEC